MQRKIQRPWDLLRSWNCISHKKMSVCWIQISSHAGSQNVKTALFWKFLITPPPACTHCSQIRLFTSYLHTLLHLKASPFTASPPWSQISHLVHPLSFSAHPSSKSFLILGIILLFFPSVSRLVMSPSPLLSSTLPWFLRLSPFCLPLCPRSPFPLSAVNGSIMSLLSMKWWEGVNAAA